MVGARELRMMPTFLKVGFAEMVAYRAEIVIWFLTTTMPLIMYAMWSTVAQQGAVGRFDEGTFASYFIITLIVRQLSAAWVVWELNYLIRSGKLSMLLLRPVHPLLYRAATNVAAMPLRIVVLAPIVGLAIYFMPKMSISTEPLRLVLFIVTCAGAWALTFVVQSLIGLLALYSEQSLSVMDAFFGVWALLSGYLIPLELMPKVQPIANLLPFRSMGSLPVEIILGHLTPEQMWTGLATQIAWLVFAFVVLRVLWGPAMRRYEAYGN